MSLEIREFITFPDHYAYHPADLRKIGVTFKETRADLILTTEKDAARITSSQSVESSGLNELYYVEIEACITEGETILHALIDSVLDRGRA